MKKLILIAAFALLACTMLVYAQEPEFDHWVFAPLVQKACTPTPRPAPTAIPTATPPRPTPTPAGPSVCDCSGDIYNCIDFATQAQAQACYDHCWQITGYDIHKLDRDKDGLACEALP